MTNSDKLFMTLCLISILCLAVFAFMDYRYLEIEYLMTTNYDEFPQIFQYQRMYEALLDLDVVKFLFSFEFYNYGFLWYILNFFVSAPFFALNSYEGAIYAPRILEALFTILNTLTLYKIAKFYTNSKIAFFIALIFIVSPAFWNVGMSVKTDMFQGFFILISAYFLCKDEMKFGKNYIFSVLFVGLGLGLAKFQAIMFMSMIYIYICLPLFINFTKQNLLIAIKRMFISLLGVVVVWIITNPYLLLPNGFNTWLGQFKFNMWSNATNHGSYIDLTIFDKIKLVDSWYMQIVVFSVFLSLCLFLIFKFLRYKFNNKLASFVALVGGFGVSLGYLFFLTNKVWINYYLSTMLLGILILALLVSEFIKKYQILLLTLLLSFQCLGGVINGTYKSTFTKYYATNLDILKKRSPIMVEALKQVAPKDKKYSILSNVGFSYTELGIDPKMGTITYDGVWLGSDFIILYKSGKLFDESKRPKKLSGYIERDIATLKALQDGVVPYEKVFDSDKVVIFKSIYFDKKDEK